MQRYQLPDQTAKFAPVWTTVLKIRGIFVHRTSTEHALLQVEKCAIFWEISHLHL